jgi:hypothetical protein
MKRVEYQVALVLIAATLPTCIIGCNEPSASGIISSDPQLTAKPDAEESFELILETFRRGVEGVRIGFVARREGGHSMMSGDNKVSHELIRPGKEGDPYKAIITVQSQSSYSLQRTTGIDDSREDNKSGSQDSQSGIGGADDPVSIDILDSDLVGKPADAGPTSRPAQAIGDTTTIARRPPTAVKKSYELQYENGRWALMSELDPETEQGIKNAFDHAFKTQL